MRNDGVEEYATLRVSCPVHGIVRLRQREYDQQLAQSGAWRCPVCTADALPVEPPPVPDPIPVGSPLSEDNAAEMRIFRVGDREVVAAMHIDDDDGTLWTVGLRGVGPLGYGATMGQAMAAALVEMSRFASKEMASSGER